MWIWVIIFIILALLMPDFHGMKKKEKNHKELLSTIKSTKPSEDTQERFPCPSCAEMVLVQANVCRYCGRDLPEDVKPDAPASNSEFEPSASFKRHDWRYTKVKPPDGDNESE